MHLLHFIVSTLNKQIRVKFSDLNNHYYFPGEKNVDVVEIGNIAESSDSVDMP